MGCGTVGSGGQAVEVYVDEAPGASHLMPTHPASYVEARTRLPIEEELTFEGVFGASHCAR